MWSRELALPPEAVTAVCAVIASGLYCLIMLAFAGVGLAVPRHAAGFISSALFLVPGFPLVGGLLDLLQHQTIGGCRSSARVRRDGMDARGRDQHALAVSPKHLQARVHEGEVFRQG